MKSLTHCGSKIIISQRLCLRPFQEEDAPALFAILSDAEVTKYLIFKPHQDLEETRSILKGWLEQYQKSAYYNWAIVHGTDDSLIGNIYLVHLHEESKEVEIGYHLGRAHWGAGYATEAVRALVRFFFLEVGVDSVSARYDARNPASGRVLEKNGFRFDKRMAGEANVNAGIGDWVMTRIRRDAFLLQFGQDQ